MKFGMMAGCVLVIAGTLFNTTLCRYRLPHVWIVAAVCQAVAIPCTLIVFILFTDMGFISLEAAVVVLMAGLYLSSVIQLIAERCGLLKPITRTAESKSQEN